MEQINFEEFYEEYFPKIYNFFYYRLLHRETAEDLTSQTFLKIAEKRYTYRPDKAGIGTWVWRISENTLIDYYRTRRQTAPMGEDWQGHSVTFEEQYEEIAAPRQRALYRALSQLSKKERTLVACKYLWGWSYRELAEKYQMNESTLASVLSRAKGKLRRILETEGSLDE